MILTLDIFEYFNNCPQTLEKKKLFDIDFVPKFEDTNLKYKIWISCLSLFPYVRNLYSLSMKLKKCKEVFVAASNLGYHGRPGSR